MLSAFVEKKNATKKYKVFRDLMLDPFGNYVVPKLIERAKFFGLMKHYDYLVKVFSESTDALKKVKHGRQLM